MKRVQNKIALITGASRGIGAASAKLLAEEGATVIITDVLDELGEKLAGEIGKQAIYYHLNVASEKNWQEIADVILKQYGKLDILFNNAGIIGLDDNFGPQDPEHLSLESWHKIHNINLDGVFLGCKYGINLMKKSGGSIINMSSCSGMVGIPGACAYASSKAAIRNHTKTVALYSAEQKYNIRCNSVAPGAILTPIWDSMFGNTPEQRSKAITNLSKEIPLGHMGESIDVAYAVLYLGSDESKYVTGTEIILDGGIMAGSAAAPK